MIRRLMIPCALAVFVSVVAAAPAAATAVGDFTVKLERPPYVAANTGRVDYEYTDSTTTTTIRLMDGATELARASVPAGSTHIAVTSAALEPGDQVEVFKPGIPAGPPAVSPTDQYAIPILSVAAAAGATSVTGTAPDGALARLGVGQGCSQNDFQSLPVTAVGGAFSSATAPVAAGADLMLRVFSGAGDYTELASAVPGETPCFSASAVPYPEQPTLDPAAATPYSVRVSNLKPTVAINSRLVWRRGGAIIGDITNPGDRQFQISSATKPLPGDVLEVYRPQTAPTPSRTATIPEATATIDTSASLVAVNTTAPAGFLDVFAADPRPSEHSSRRASLYVPAGRTLLDFNAPQGDQRAFKMHPVTRASVGVYSPDWRINYYFYASPGDLVAPAVSATLKSRLKLSKIKKSIAIRLKSNETATGTATLVVPKKLPGKGHPKTKPGKRTITFASAKLALNAGSQSVKLKLSKAGLKALKQLRGAGRSMRDVKATLKLNLTDPSGNTTNVTRSMKLVVK